MISKGNWVASLTELILSYTGKTFRSKESKIHNEVLSIVENALNRKGDVINSFSYIVSVSVAYNHCKWSLPIVVVPGEPTDVKTENPCKRSITLRWGKPKLHSIDNRPLVGSQGAHTICLCSWLLFYSKCTGFTVCFTYSDISLTMCINQWKINVELPYLWYIVVVLPQKRFFERVWFPRWLFLIIEGQGWNPCFERAPVPEQFFSPKIASLRSQTL